MSSDTVFCKIDKAIFGRFACLGVLDDATSCHRSTRGKNVIKQAFSYKGTNVSTEERSTWILTRMTLTRRRRHSWSTHHTRRKRKWHHTYEQKKKRKKKMDGRKLCRVGNSKSDSYLQEEETETRREEEPTFREEDRLGKDMKKNKNKKNKKRVEKSLQQTYLREMEASQGEEAWELLREGATGRQLPNKRTVSNFSSSDLF
jgi:hypothetical protein